jgi:hypothetical protein
MMLAAAQSLFLLSLVGALIWLTYLGWASQRHE